jgi:hypothetical protein
MGDTHVRNVFLALVAAVRRREFFAEDDRFAHQLFHYSVGSRRDHMRLVRLSSIRGLTPQQAGAHPAIDGACSPCCVPATLPALQQHSACCGWLYSSNGV